MIPVCISDFEQYAEKSLPKMAFDYYSGGADEERSLKRNVAVFEKLLIRPRFFRNVSQIDTNLDLWDGKLKLNSPICIAATASQKMAHPEGEIATVRAAKLSQTLMSVSTIATTSLEDVASEAKNDDGVSMATDLFFQLYICKDMDLTLNLIKRAEIAGYRALVITVDTPVSGKRRRDLKNGFALPGDLRMANFDEAISRTASLGMNDARKGESGFAIYMSAMFEDDLTLDKLKFIKKQTNLPIILKGIMTAEDACEACLHFDGIIISNHGARQLDSVPSTMEVLPEIRTTVNQTNKKCEIFIDGGFRSGNDVFKALALGAKAVFIGRPILWGLAYKGHEGVTEVMNILNQELKTTMALSGCQNINDIRKAKNLVVSENFYKFS